MNTRKALINSPRLRAKKRRKSFILFTIFFLIVAILAGGSFYILNLDVLRIQGVSVRGVKVINEVDVKTEIEKILEETYLGISRNNILLYPKSFIKERILEIFSVAKFVDIDLKSKELLVTIVEKKPEALWCRTTCFFIDDTGVIYKPSPVLEGDVFVSFRESGETPLTLGTKIIDPGVLRSVLDGVVSLQKEKFSVWSVSVINNDEFRLEDSSGMDIIINPFEDISSQTERVKKVFESKELTTKSFSSLQYIDARFGAKLFLKEKELSTPN